MKFIRNGSVYNVDIRFVPGIRILARGRYRMDAIFACTKEGHSFEGNRRELRKHLRSEHPEIFDEVNLKC